MKKTLLLFLLLIMFIPNVKADDYLDKLIIDCNFEDASIKEKIDNVYIVFKDVYGQNYNYSLGKENNFKIEITDQIVDDTIEIVDINTDSNTEYVYSALYERDIYPSTIHIEINDINSMDVAQFKDYFYEGNKYNDTEMSEVQSSYVEEKKERSINILKIMLIAIGSIAVILLTYAGIKIAKANK